MKRGLLGLLSAAVLVAGGAVAAQDDGLGAGGVVGSDVEMKGEGHLNGDTEAAGIGGSGAEDERAVGVEASDQGVGGSGTVGSGSDRGSAGDADARIDGQCLPGDSNCPAGLEQGTGGSGARDGGARLEGTDDLGTGGAGPGVDQGGEVGRGGGLDDPTGVDLGTGGTGAAGGAEDVGVGAGGGGAVEPSPTSDTVPPNQDSAGDIQPRGEAGTGGGGAAVYGPTGEDVSEYTTDTSDDTAATREKRKEEAGTGGAGAVEDNAEAQGTESDDPGSVKRDIGDRTPSTLPENPADRGPASSMPEEPGTY